MPESAPVMTASRGCAGIVMCRVLPARTPGDARLGGEGPGSDRFCHVDDAQGDVPRDPVPARPDVEPLDVTGVRTVAVGTVLFLLAGLALLATRQNNDISPLYCSHDTLTVCADPAAFTAAEIEWLEGIGFHANRSEETFYSYRFGSA